MIVDADLLQMIVVSLCKSVCHAVHCAKTAEQIKMLFGVNTPGAQGTFRYMGVLIPAAREMGSFAHCEPTTYLSNSS